MSLPQNQLTCKIEIGVKDALNSIGNGDLYHTNYKDALFPYYHMDYTLMISDKIKRRAITSKIQKDTSSVP